MTKVFILFVTLCAASHVAVLAADNSLPCAAGGPDSRAPHWAANAQTNAPDFRPPLTDPVWQHDM
jgi:hypothetical protein